MRPWGITHPGGRQNGAAELSTKPWWHTDQRPSKRGMHCIQGFLTLTPVGHDAGAFHSLNCCLSIQLISVPESQLCDQRPLKLHCSGRAWRQACHLDCDSRACVFAVPALNPLRGFMPSLPQNPQTPPCRPAPTGTPCALATTTLDARQAHWKSRLEATAHMRNTGTASHSCRRIARLASATGTCSSLRHARRAPPDSHTMMQTHAAGC